MIVTDDVIILEPLPYPSTIATTEPSNTNIQLESSTQPLLKQVKAWIYSCNEGHSKCQEDVDKTWCPSRLISISSVLGLPKAKLVLREELEPLSEIVVYFALSHKWGTRKFNTLQSANLQEYRQQIPIFELRKTFQDAIQITLDLGISYLWIDSLCIIQDSRDDWHSESSVMHLVYRNAFATLAASEAEVLEQGLLDVSRPSLLTAFPQSLNLLGRPENFMVRCDPERFYKMRLDGLPLKRRGWVLQESLLSRRTIYFGSPLIWECRECLRSIGWPGEIRVRYPLLNQPKLWPTMVNGQNSHTVWQIVVSTFSRCVLTKSSDKLVALSGIAKTISSQMESEYIAGLWKSHIWYDLLWIVQDISISQANKGSTNDLEFYRGPPSSCHVKAFIY